MSASLILSIGTRAHVCRSTTTDDHIPHRLVVNNVLKFLPLAPTSPSSLIHGCCWLNVPYVLSLLQDELGNRRACEQAASAALHNSSHVVIDRCNFNPQQRRTWLQLAAAYTQQPVCVMALHLNVPLHVCKQRVAARIDHPTLFGAHAAGVVHRWATSVGRYLGSVWLHIWGFTLPQALRI